MSGYLLFLAVLLWCSPVFIAYSRDNRNLTLIAWMSTGLSIGFARGLHRGAEAIAIGVYLVPWLVMMVMAFKGKPKERKP
jgi:hypothetical protein